MFQGGLLLKKIPFYHSTDIRFLKTGDKTLVITPDPRCADSLRLILPEVNVITIADFISSSWKKEIIRKSNFMLTLGAAWKILHPQKSYIEFSRIFNLFTDLRSYSLDFEVISSVLEKFDTEVVKSVQYFWLLYEKMNICDEHQVYFELAKKLPFLEKKQDHFIFFGFNFFSNMQLNFLESLGQYYDVDVVVPAIILDRSSRFDWPNWLSGEVSSPLNADNRENFNVNIVRYHGNNLNQTLKNFIAQKSFSNCDIITTQNKINLEKILEIPLNDHFFKSSENILESHFLKAHDSLEKVIGESNVSLLDHVGSVLEREIEKQDFRGVKNWMMIKDFFQRLLKESRENIIFEKFDWDLMKEVLTLEHPRLSYVPLHEKSARGRFLSIKDNLDSFDIPKIVIHQSKYQGLRTVYFEYDPDIVNSLSVIGPIKRPYFDSLFIVQSFYEIFSHGNNYLFLENNIEEEDLAWKQLLEDWRKQDINIPLPKKDKKIVLKKKKELDGKGRKISTGMLQTYVDCPQKYYYKYVDKINRKEEIGGSLLPREQGIIEHESIENFFSQNKDVSSSCEYCMRNFCLNNHKSLDDMTYAITLSDIKKNVQSGVSYLFDFKKNLTNPKIKFEVRVNNEFFAGRADCIISSDEGDYLFDFKRSSFGIPSKNEVMEFNSIQLLYYATHLFREEKSFNWKSISYINLSNLDKSLHLDISSSELLQEYRYREELIINKLKRDQYFIPSPRKKEICQYCDLKLICNKKDAV